jgi:hypothetical protein
MRLPSFSCLSTLNAFCFHLTDDADNGYVAERNAGQKRKATVSPKPTNASKRSKNCNKSTKEGRARTTNVVDKTKKVAKQTKVVCHTVDSVLSQWSDTTEYGISFRGLSTSEQHREVEVLNKGTAKGMKGIVKQTLLTKQYEKIVGDKLRQYFIDSRVPLESMFHTSSKTQIAATANLKFFISGRMG